MARIDFTPVMVLLVMTVGVVALRFLGTPQFKTLMGQIDQLITQMFTVQAAPPPPAPTPPPAAPTPTPAPEPEEEEPEGITPATPPPKTTPPAPKTTPPSTTKTAGAGCNCSCMPMDSDPNRQKIETPDGVDCANHEYPGSVAECETLLATVADSPCCCGGSSGGGSSTPASSGGDDEEEDEEEEDEDEESGNLARIFNVGGLR